MSDGTRPVIIRIKNPHPNARGWWYWTGSATGWGSTKETAKVFDCDYDAAAVIIRFGLKQAVVINA